MDSWAYFFERNNEKLLLWQDSLYPNDFPCIFMPKEKENWLRSSVALATKEDIENVRKEGIEILVNKEAGSEFFYATDDFVNPTGHLKNRINKFKISYNYSIAYESTKEKIINFYNFWKSQREHESFTFDDSEYFFKFCLDNLEKYNIQQVYVEIEGKIVGLAWGMSTDNPHNWIGLHLKVDYQYKGLSRFLHHERAKMFKDSKEFSIGMGAGDKGISKYKEELGPVYKKEYRYIITGNRSLN